MALNLIIRLVEELNLNNIRFCHFKSNEHIEAAVNGMTDLDILFDISSQNDTDHILRKVGFLKAKAVWFCSYKFVEDYLAIDPDSGVLVHVHAHFKLVAGERRVKSYIIPLEELMLSNRRFDAYYNIYIADPAVELLLLFIRYAIKFHSSNLILGMKLNESSDANREYVWLKEQVTPDQIIYLTRSVLGNSSVDSVNKLFSEGLTKKNLKLFYDNTKKTLHKFRRYSKIKSDYLFIIRNSFHLFQNKINRKLTLFDIPGHRTLNSSGVIIALMGSDGSGKSTQMIKLKKKLLSKLDTIAVYMGSGKGKSGILRLPMVLFIKLKIRISSSGEKKSMNTNELTSGSIKRNTIYQLPKIVWALTLALERRRKLRRINRAKKKGMIIICDRYPQTSITDYNDGPLLSRFKDRSNRLMKKLAQWEWKQYDLANKIYPDIVIKYIADPETLLARRPGMNVNTLIRKQQGILDIKFNEETKIHIMDTKISIDEVTASSMIAIGKIFGLKCD